MDRVEGGHMGTTEISRHVGSRLRRGIVMAAVAGAIALVGAACGSSGGSSSPPATSAAAPSGPSTHVTATLTEFHIALSTMTFTPGSYTFDVTNAGSATHALAISGPGVSSSSATLQGGGTAKLTVTLQAGTYELTCPVDGHKGLGMDMKITVGGSAAGAGASATTASAGGGGYGY
jgi:plastocyanin